MNRARDRYLHFWLDYAGKNQESWPLLKKEFDQLRRVWEMLNWDEAVQMPPGERAARALNFLFSLDDFIEKQGLLQENIHWIETGMEAAQRLGRFDLLGRLGQDLGWCYRSLGQPGRALDYLQLALDVRQKHGPPIGEAVTSSLSEKEILATNWHGLTRIWAWFILLQPIFTSL